MENKKRIDYIDILRAIGILSMIISHVGCGKRVDFFIHAWHMPMFFIISGYFYKQKNEPFFLFLKHKFRTLLVPYFVFGIINFLLCLIFYDKIQPTIPNKLDPLVELFADNTFLPLTGALWFFTAMFFCNLIYYLVNKIFRNMILMTIVVVLISTFGCCATLLLTFRLPLAIDAAFVGVGLYHIGRGLKWVSNRFIIFNLKIPVWLLLTIFSILLIYQNGYINMKLGTYSIIPLFWINAVLDTIVLWNASRWLEEIFSLNKIGVSYYLKSIGKDSIVYLCFNQIVIFLISLALSGFCFSTLIERCATLIFTLIMLFLLNYFIQSTWVKHVFGK